MKGILLTIFFLYIWNQSFTQLWTFEFECDYNSHTDATWVSKNSEGTIHSIGINKVEGSGIDRRTRLIQLDNEGHPISLFYARECEVPGVYYPYRKDQYISISQDCNGRPIQTINIFNNKGERIWKKVLNKNYYFHKILSHEDEVTFISQEISSRKPEDFKIVRLNKRLKIEEQVVSLADLRENGHHTKIFNAIQVGSNRFLLAVQIFDVNDRSAIKWLSSKVVMIENGEIKWVNKLQGSVKVMRELQQHNFDYIIFGRVSDGKPIIIRLDENGREIHRFSPKSTSRGTFTQFHNYNDKIFSIDKYVRRSIIVLKEYNAYDGSLLNEWEISTPYTRIGALNIGWIYDKSLIITGICFKDSPYDGPYAGFVMKVNRPGSTLSYHKEEYVQTRISENLILEVSNEVSSVKVFPNPTQFKVTFQIDSVLEEDRILKLFDLSGKEILAITFYGAQVEIDVSHLTPATYIYTILTQGELKIMSGKIIKG